MAYQKQYIFKLRNDSVPCDLCMEDAERFKCYYICDRCLDLLEWDLCKEDADDYENLRAMMVDAFTRLPKYTQVARTMRDGPIENWSQWND